MSEIIVNSFETANEYWETKYGIVSDDDDIMDMYNELDELRHEQLDMTKKIQSVPTYKINNHNINRSIELYFLLKAGDDYLIKCMDFTDIYDELS